MPSRTPDLLSRVATALAHSILHPGAAPWTSKILDYIQHIADCRAAAASGSDFTTTIPFALIWEVSDAETRLLDCNCTSAEAEWLRKALGVDSLERLVQDSDAKVAELGVFVPHFLQMEDSSGDHWSFKTKVFSGEAVSLFLSLDSLQLKTHASRAQSLLLHLVMPSPFHAEGEGALLLHGLREHCLPILRRELQGHLLEFRLENSPDESSSDPLPAYHGVDEAQHSFDFLAPILDELHGRIKTQLAGTEAELQQEFAATFLFRTSPRREGPRYRYVFTKSQRKALEEVTLEELLRQDPNVDARLQSLVEISGLDNRGRAAISTWIDRQREETLLNILGRASWYGPRSFVNYTFESRNKSLYISDWRFWYPREVRIQDFQTIERLNQTDEMDDALSGELSRFVRSEIEESCFGLRSMFLIPVDSSLPPLDAGPIAVVQVASRDRLDPEKSLRILSLLDHYKNEIRGYTLADAFRGELEKRAKFEQFLDIAHTFTHSVTKRFSTPIYNTLRRFEVRAERDELSGVDGIDRWGLRNGIHTVRELQIHLDLLHRFAGEEGKLEDVVTEVVDWRRIGAECKEGFETAFFRHFWDVCHDARYAKFKEYIRRQALYAHEFITLDFEVSSELPRCHSHSSLLGLHLMNLLENAIESFDLSVAADRWLRRLCPLHSASVRVDAGEGRRFLVLSVTNTGTITPEEKIKLGLLEQVLAELRDDRLDPFLRPMRERMHKREFCTKSGGGRGWAVLQCASYLRRLEVHRAGEKLRHGAMFIRFANRPEQLIIELKIPVVANGGEEVHYLQYC